MKRAWIILAVVVTALSLVGCDAILSTLYPEFKDSGTGNGNIIVEVSYDSTISSFGTQPNTFGGNSFPIVVELVPFSQSFDPATNNYVYSPISGAIESQKAYSRDFIFDSSQGRTLKRFTFPVNQNSTFKVIAFVDTNNDGEPDNSTTTPIKEPGTIVLTQQGKFFLDLSYHKSTDPNISMGTTLSATSQISWPQFFADPANQGGNSTGNQAPLMPRIDVPSLTVPSGTPIIMRSTNESDPDGWIADRVWTITQSGMGAETLNGMQELGKTFTNPGTSPIPVTVSLVVKDNMGAPSPAATITLQILPASATNQLPYSLIMTAPTQVNSGQGFSLYSSSYDNDGFITSYEWTVADAVHGSQQYLGSSVYLAIDNPNASPLAVTVSLRVQDNTGVWNDTPPNGHPSAQVSISVLPSGAVALDNPPIVQFNVSPAETVPEGTSMTFDSNSYDNESFVAQEEWFLNGVQQGVTYYGSYSYFYWTPPAAGTYTIMLTATDSTGHSASLSKTINVVSTSGPGSSPSNPVPLNGFTARYSDTVIAGSSVFYQVNGLPGTGNQRIRLHPLGSDNDLYVYADQTMVDEIGSSANGVGMDDIVLLVNGETQVFIEVYGYGGGPYDLFVETY